MAVSASFGSSSGAFLSSSCCTLPARPRTSATSTKISGSAGMRGWNSA